MRIYELPATMQKSFYGKANVLDAGGEISLKSYDTIMLTVRDGEVVWFSDYEWNYSTTTMRHVNAFLEHVGLPTTNIAKVRMSLQNGEWYDE